MYPLIRRYLRRVDVVYLLLCAACSAISVVVLLSIGQTQLGSNNKAAVQLIASLLGLMLAVVFSTADYHALARAWPLHGVVAWGLVLPTLFLHNVNTGLVTIGYDAGGTSNYSWYRVGGMTFQPAELAKISFILTLALHLSQVRGQVNRPKNLLLLFVHIALPAAAIQVQGDDGTALVFLGIGLVMLYAGGLSHWLVAGGLTAGVVGGAALLTLRPGSQAHRLVSILSVAGEFPIRALHLLGKERVLRDLVRRLTVPQRIRNPSTGEYLESKLLQLTGKGASNSIRVYKGALPILEWRHPDAYRYYMESFWEHRFPGDQAHRDRNHRVAEALALCAGAGVEIFPYRLPKLQMREIRLTVPPTPSLY